MTPLTTVSSLRAVLIWLLLAPLLTAQTSMWRPVYLARDGLVSSAHYGAAMAGYRMLAQGGNAIDAAVAASFASTVVEPSRAGIGGDLFILIYWAQTNEVKFINACGWAPRKATIGRFRELGGLKKEGALGPVVPGAPAGLLLASEKYGRLSREKLLAPAIELAQDGFVVSENLQNVFRRNLPRLAPFPTTTRKWFRDGRPVRMGDVVVQKDLANTFRRIAAQGHGGFYGGPVAKRIVEALAGGGGLMELSDLAEFTAEETTPAHVSYKGYDVYGVPPQSQGPVMLEAMKTLEGIDLKAMGHNSADYIHYVAEALKLAFADREKYIADPRFAKDIPLKELFSAEYAERRRKLIRKDRAIDGTAPAGDPRALRAAVQPPQYAAPRGWHRVLHGAAAHPRWIDSLTTYVGVVDKDRNMVSITSSIASDYGNGMYIDGDGGGFFINNRLAGFHLDPDHVNALAPRKRPRMTVNPVLVMKDGKLLMVFGTPGGDTQPQSQLQFFLNFVEFGMNPQQAVEQPYFVTRSYHNSWYPHEAGDGLAVSERIDESVREDLALRGHNVSTHSAMGVGSIKTVVIDPRTGVLMAGAAPATDSYAVGW